MDALIRQIWQMYYEVPKKPAVIERTLLLMRVIHTQHTRDETQAEWGGGRGRGAPSLIDLRQTEISSNLFHGTKQMLLFIPQKLYFCRSL